MKVINSISAPKSYDPRLSKSLEAIIKELAADDSKRKANTLQQANRLQQIASQLNDDGEVASRQLERIIEGNDLTDINYLAIGTRRARSVARIVIRQNRRTIGLATGFLVAPGVLLTNQHVFESADMVKESAQGKALTKDGAVWTDGMSDDQIDWIANEGVRISKILEYLQQSYPNHPLAQAILSTEEPPAPSHESFATDIDSASGIRIVKDRDGNTKIMVLVELDLAMKVNWGASLTNTLPPAVIANSSTSTGNAISAAATSDAEADEKVVIDTSNYAARNGFQADFLGDDFKVPLPKVVGTKFGKPLKIIRNSTELKYWNYSVVMNADRGLAFFSAANIMPKERRGSQDGNTFIRDDRFDHVNKKAQIGNEFYKKQSTFEADNRGTNPFDQGHLSRRENLQWGRNDDIAKRNGDDSFHYTNCAPQHCAFNQVRKISGLWNRLEVSAIETLSSGNKICVINGPVFNAPESHFGDDGMPLLNLNGARKKAPTFGGIAIPKLFFKLIAYRKDNELHAKACVVSQENVLKTVGRLKDSEASTLSDEELDLYQVEIKDLEKLTGLKFGIPAASDTPHAVEVATPEGGRPIYTEDQLFQ